jgi:hypothetical protein
VTSIPRPTRQGAFPDPHHLRTEAEPASEMLCSSCTFDNAKSPKQSLSACNIISQKPHKPESVIIRFFVISHILLNLNAVTFFHMFLNSPFIITVLLDTSISHMYGEESIK